MRREGTNDDNVQMSDVMCDSCGSEWTHERPMVEGHQGSCICGPCLTVAYTELVVDASPDDDETAEERSCTLCLESKTIPMWQSPMTDSAWFCRQCLKRAAGVLHKDPDIPWAKPS